jgi:zinc transporter ZupT
VLVPLLITLSSVAVGVAVGLCVRAAWARVVRVVAAGVAVVAVVGQLLPEAIQEAGWQVLALFAVAVVTPMVADSTAGKLARRGAGLGFEIAYGSLLIHQLADGLAIGALASVDHDHGHELSYAAIAVHTVALAALFVLLVRERSGWRQGLWRGCGMAAAVCAGVGLVTLVPTPWVEVAHPWVVAAAAGGLMHVAMHPIVEGGVKVYGWFAVQPDKLPR